MSAPLSPTTDRQAFRTAVATVAEKAKKILPQEVNGRLESAVKLVLMGDVEMLDDGTVKVGSSDPTRWYHLIGTACTCTDFTQGKAPEGWCKHRIAAGINKRVEEMSPAPPAPVEAPPVPLPEAPASVNCHLTIAGRQVQLTLRDTDEGRLLARLTTILAQYPPTAVEHEAATAHVCPTHQVPMRQTTKNGRSWYSHRTEEGWCKGGRP